MNKKFKTMQLEKNYTNPENHMLHIVSYIEANFESLVVYAEFEILVKTN